MRAVVLVGGEGTRLRPLTSTTPKQLLPVAGVPMIERVVARLAGHGVDSVVLSMGYRAEAFAEAYPDETCAGVPVAYAVEPERMDTAGAVRFAADAAGIDDTFVVVNADVLTDADLGALIAFHRRTGAEATIGLTPVDDPSRYGVVPTDDEGRVVAFIEKPPADEAPTNLINAGCYVLEASVLDAIEPGRRVSIERETFPGLVAKGSLYALASDAYWIDAGTPAAYVQANVDALERVAGGVVVGAGAVIAESACVERSALGASCRVEDGASVVDAVLLPGAVVEAGARVRRSAVGAGAVIGAGAVVDDLTLVGDGVSVPAGSRHAAGRVA